MNAKGILKMKSNGKDRFMHYLLENRTIKILSLNNTELIEEIKLNPNIYITTDVKDDATTAVIVTMNQEKEDIKAIFNKMIEEKNTYFKEFDERLIILEITI